MEDVFELKPILVAGVIGAIALYAATMIMAGDISNPSACPTCTATTAAEGFAIGAIVQIGVRMVGVS